MTQLQAIDHAAGSDENNQPFTINYTVTDGDGDTATSTLAISVDDDTPTAGANAKTVIVDDDDQADGIPNGTGDDAPAFTTGTLAHNYGADGAGTTLLTGAGCRRWRVRKAHSTRRCRSTA